MRRVTFLGRTGRVPVVPNASEPQLILQVVCLKDQCQVTGLYPFSAEDRTGRSDCTPLHPVRRNYPIAPFLPQISDRIT